MSWRQIRKTNNTLLHQHQSSCSSASDGDDDSNTSSSSGKHHQPTSPPMFVTKSKQAKKAVSQKVAESGNAGIQRQQQQVQHQQLKESSSPSAPSGKPSKTDQPSSKKQQPAPQGKKQVQKQPSNKNTTNKKKHDEDERLLRELEAQRRRDDGESSSSSSSSSSPGSDDDGHDDQPRQREAAGDEGKISAKSVSDARKIIESLLSVENKFSSRVYDPRTERIQRFGKDSVERVTDDVNSAKKRFRPSPFVTPNQSNWPPFDVCGARLRKKESQSQSQQQGKSSKAKSSVSEYVVDVSSDDSSKAEASLQNAVDSSDLDALFAHWRKYSYHLPTLMQVYRTASMINQDEISRQAIDMALYTSGIILAAFPEAGSYFADRRLDGRASRGSAMVLQVLHLGVHQALKKGCGRTAFELCKLLLSMDCEDDVECAWSIADYVAIRASQFDWIQDLAKAMEQLSLLSSSSSSSSPAAAAVASAISSPSSTSSYLYASLLERSRVLPQLVFGPALAFCFQHDSDKCPDRCLHDAILPAVKKMPMVAAEIAVAVGLPDNTPGLAEIMSNPNFKQNAAQQRITQLYVKRNTELWRTKNLPGLLRKAIGEYASDEQQPPIASNGNVITLVQRHYGYDESEEHIMGSSPPAVPQELLNGAGADGRHEERGVVDAHGNVVRGAGAGAGGFGMQQQGRWMLPPETPEHIRDTILRFEALFGPLRPPLNANNNNNNNNNNQHQQQMTLQDILDRYDEMLRDRVARRKQNSSNENANDQRNHENDNDNDDDAEESCRDKPLHQKQASSNNFLVGAAATFVDFFRTMIPDLSSIITTRNDMLLQEMRESGIPDPVRVRNERFDREHPHDMMLEPVRPDDVDDDDDLE